MDKKHSTVVGLPTVLFTGFCLALANLTAAEGGCSLTEREIKLSDARVAFESLAKENTDIRARLEQSEASLRVAQKNLSLAIEEGEQARRSTLELKQRFEALGLEVGGGDLDKIRQRLLKAVSDLRVSNDENLKIREAARRLMDSVAAYKIVSVTDDKAALEAIDTALKGASEALSSSSTQKDANASLVTTLRDGTVISVKEELALIVCNFGVQHGAKVGMPFQVSRDDSIVGTVRIVDSRDRIAGAVIQDLSSETEKIRVGDRLKVITAQSQTISE